MLRLSCGYLFCVDDRLVLVPKRGSLLIFRFFSLALIAFSLFAFTPRTRAQISVYGTASNNAFGFSGDNYPNGPSFKPRATGFTAGVFYMLPSFGRFRTGFDGRVTSSPGYNGGKAYTVGFRAGFVPYRFPLRPYVQFGGGAMSTQIHENLCNGFGCSQRTSQITGGAVQLAAGLDVHINRMFDIRAFDYESDSGGSAGSTHPALRSFSAGAVYHLPSRNLRNP